jgi:serine protease Do
VGNPFGLEATVTAGIISAKGRGLGITAREEFLQTDAAINPGNSGGPLLNLRGEVVGINTAISSTSGGYQGVGFTIPINLAKWVSQQLIQSGAVHRAFLGVGIQPLTPELAEQLGLKITEGCLVTEVRPDSPASKATLKSGDVIVGFGGKAVANPRELVAVVEQAPIGSKQALAVFRDGQRVDLEVTLLEQPADYGIARETPGQPGQPDTERMSNIGLEVGALTQKMAQRLGMEGAEGVVITAVQPGSPAELAGLRPLMVIVRVGQKAVKSVDEFRSAMKDQSVEKGVLLLVRSQAGSQFVVVKGGSK